MSASPLVAAGMRLPRGGGYEKVGKPYTVKGTVYVPTENPEPVQAGRASWYGKAFHGRLTANGEVFDMNHLTGAHKTMPLPSYARVTNSKNGRSVIVRINDRGPFSKKRVIDVSKRAAQILDFVNDGTAEVRVEYVGPAPLHGNDDEYLMASVRGPGEGVPTMVASASYRVEGDLPGVRDQSAIPVTNASFDAAPIIRPRPETAAELVSAYADFRIGQAFTLPGGNPGWKSR